MYVIVTECHRTQYAVILLTIEQSRTIENIPLSVKEIESP